MRRRQYTHKFIAALFLVCATLLVISSVSGQQPFIPNGAHFPNPGGTSQTYSTAGRGIELTGPFFQNLGTNGRTCGTCHQPADGMSISAADVQQRFLLTKGEDPIFRTVDGSNCNHSIDTSTLTGKETAYSLLRTRGLIRIPIAVPANANYRVVNVSNQYGCNESDVISMYRRPLPTTNLRFLSTVMFDGRESTSFTPGTTKLTYYNYPTALLTNLKHQSVSATTGHAQGDGTRPTSAEQQEIVDFEMALFTAQATGNGTGSLDAQGATGGPQPLVTRPFFISINSSVNPLVPTLEQPGGITAGDGKFTPVIFNTFDAWAKLPPSDPRASVARGQALFNSVSINITGVAGINDPASTGGLLPNGASSLQGNCATCHDTPNVGNHSFPTPLDIGTGDPNPSNPSVNLGGLDISYLPAITVCKTDAKPATCKTTTDLGQALIDGNYDHVGKIKGPILRGLSARAPYFHNGSAQTLLDAVRFYETRFGLVLTSQQETDLVAFLGSL